jgi:hypothetical protein
MTRAFTIAEVLVSLALLAMLTLALYMFVDDVGARRERLLDRSRADAAASSIIDRVEADLVSTFARDADGEPGLRGDASTLRILRRGTPTGARERTGCEITFDPRSGRVEGRILGDESPAEEIGRLARLRFRYFDGREWLESFDSAQKGSLPVCIEVSAWLWVAPPSTSPGVPSEGDLPPEDDRAVSWGMPDRARVIALPDTLGEPEARP